MQKRSAKFFVVSLVGTSWEATDVSDWVEKYRTDPDSVFDCNII